MSAPLEPQRVEIADVRHWQRESVALFWRRPLLFVGLTAGYFFAAQKLQINSWISFVAGILLCQAILSLIVVVARCVDHTVAIAIRDCYRALLNAILVIALFSLVYALIWYVAALVSLIIPNDQNSSEALARGSFTVLDWIAPGVIDLMIVYLCIMVTGLWFLLPISTFHSLGLIDAVKLAKFAEQKNFLVVLVASYVPFSLFFIGYMVTDWAMLIAVPALPLCGIYFYVVYRHVFLGKRDNQVVPIATTSRSQIA